jgi:hypothetical protein
MSSVKVSYDEPCPPAVRTIVFGLSRAIEPLCATPAHMQLHSLAIKLLLHNEVLVRTTDELGDSIVRGSGGTIAQLWQE